MPRQYPPELRQRAVRRVEEALPGHATELEEIKKVASQLGVSRETVRRWCRQEEINEGLPKSSWILTIHNDPLSV